jgi:hypothetical protein
MNFEYFDSSALEQIGYDDIAMELYVVFKGGKTCIYSQVPPDVHKDFINSGSKGTFLHEVIKARGYSFRYA